MALSESVVEFSIEEQALSAALTELGKQADLEIAFAPTAVSEKKAPAVIGRMTSVEALQLLLADSGLYTRRSKHGVILVVNDSLSGTEQNREAKVRNQTGKKGLLAGVSTLFAAFSANAQDGGTSGDVEVNDDVIIVTSQRREESLQEVPIAITALDSSRLQRSGVTDPSRLEFAAPNVTFGQAGADSQTSIRGTSTTGFEVNSDPVIGLFVDGVYQSRPAQALAGFVDLERVEILRGPQGTLYGRNVTGGAINIISKKPTNEFDFSVEGMAGNFNAFGVRGFVNVPLGDRVALRIAGTRDVRDGYAVNRFLPNDDRNDEDQIFLRGSLKADLTDQTEVLFRANYWKQEGSGGGFQNYKIIGQAGLFDQDPIVGINPFVPAFTVAGVDPNGNPSDPYEFDSDIPGVRDIEQSQFSLDINHDFGPVTFTSITSYNNFNRLTSFDGDFTELAIFDWTVDGQAKTFTQEIRLASNTDGPFDWLVGAFFLDDEVNEQFDIPVLPDAAFFGFGPPLFIERTGLVETQSYAVFGQATLELTPGLRVTGGGRWTRDEKEAAIVDVGFAPINFTDQADFSKVTWRGALDYDLTDNTLLYGSAASGFKSGGFNLNGTPAYDPETVINYEVGLKQTLDGGFINVALFWSEFDDLQVNSFDAATISTFVLNAAESTVRGVEVEGEYSPDDYWTLTGSVAYLDATYGRFVTPDIFGGAPAPNPPVLDPMTMLPLAGFVDLDGRRLPRAPEFTAKLALSRDIPIGNLGTLRPLVQFSYSSEFFHTEFNQALDRQGDYTKTDLRLFWESADDRFFGEVFVQNLENEAVLTYGIYGPVNGMFANYGAPRTFGVRFGYNHNSGG